MNKSNFRNYFIIFIIIIIFSGLRLQIISSQNVPYTYDQGRDFLKAAEIVLYKNPTFIGPTTGIQGLYHGAWWYYLLSIPFLLFHGWPIGFYYFHFGIHLLLFVLFLFFVKKYFDDSTFFIAALLISISPYSIMNATFLGNNTMAPVTFIIFLIANFIILEKKYSTRDKLKFALFISGLMLGLTAEFELSFGLMIIPAYFFLSLFIKKLRKILYGQKEVIFFYGGLAFALLPRLLFEIKNGFSQTKILLIFFIQPKLFNPKPYNEIVADRLRLFLGYYQNLFPNVIILYLFTAILIFLVFYLFKQKDRLWFDSIKFLVGLLTLLFLFSTFYKDNFWANYYEGLPFIFIFIAILVLNQRYQKQIITQLIKQALIITLIINSVIITVKTIGSKQPYEGLKVHQDIVEYILTKEKDLANYCVRIYTPPVIPYTYNYLFLYSNLAHQIPLPKHEWQNNHCWFIVETDAFSQRRQKWLKQNNPKNGEIIITKKIKDVEINYWKTND